MKRDTAMPVAGTEALTKVLLELRGVRSGMDRISTNCKLGEHMRMTETRFDELRVELDVVQSSVKSIKEKLQSAQSEIETTTRSEIGTVKASIGTLQVDFKQVGACR